MFLYDPSIINHHINGPHAREGALCPPLERKSLVTRKRLFLRMRIFLALLNFCARLISKENASKMMHFLPKKIIFNISICLQFAMYLTACRLITKHSNFRMKCHYNAKWQKSALSWQRKYNKHKRKENNSYLLQKCFY